MADSVIKLGNYDQDTLTDLKAIPAIAVPTYQDLEHLSFKVFKVDSDKFKVHFHLKERACKACVDEYCWDAGIYFNMQAFKDGDLLIVAHFQVTPAAEVISATAERAPLRSVLRGTSAEPSVQAVPRSEPFVTSFNETEELRVETILSSVGSSLAIPPFGDRIARALPPPGIEAIDLTGSPPRPRQQQISRQSSRAPSDKAPRQSPSVQHLHPPIRQPSLQAPQEQNRYRSFEPPSRWRTYVPAQAPDQQHRFEWRQPPAPSSGAARPLAQQDSLQSHKRRRVVESPAGNPTPSLNTYGNPKPSLSTSRNPHAPPRTSENPRMLLPATPPQNAPVPSSRPAWHAINRPDTIEHEAKEDLPIVNNIWRYGLLPAHVKGAQWAPDFAAAQEKLMHIHEQKRSNHAHAEMINGVYGIVAAKPCVHCTKPCRIYHPALQPDVSRNLGFVCAGCRLKSRPGGCNAA